MADETNLKADAARTVDHLIGLVESLGGRMTLNLKLPDGYRLSVKCTPKSVNVGRGSE